MFLPLVFKDRPQHLHSSEEEVCQILKQFTTLSKSAMCELKMSVKIMNMLTIALLTCH